MTSVPYRKIDHAVRIYRFEPLQQSRLAVALALLMGFAIVSVMAGTQASSHELLKDVPSVLLAP